MKKRYKIAIISLLIIILPQLGIFPEELHNATHTKIVLIGIDGLEWSIIEDLLKDNKMPSFAGLMRHGTYGKLYTILEYTSPSLWTTIATGKQPEAHGITQHIFHEKGLYQPVYPKSYHRKARALWNILTDKGKTMGIINYPCTRPAETVRGFIISGELPVIKDTFPDKLIGEVNSVLESSANTSKDFFSELKTSIDYRDDLSNELKNHLLDGQVWRLSVIAPYLYQKFNGNLDLFMIYLYDTDYISHIFWKFMEPEYFQHKAWGLNSGNTEKYANVVKEMYQNVDKFVKKLIEEVTDENTIVIICSDHGFRNGPSIPTLSFSNLDKLLEKIGVLYFKPGYGNEAKEVDFSKSQAYHYQMDEPHSYSSVFISINLKGREPNGIVDPGEEYIKLKKRLIEYLSDLKIKETNEKLFSSVSESHLLESDIQLSLKHDISLVEQHVEIGGKTYPLADFYTLLDKSGDHSDPGVIIISGKNIKQGGILPDAHILDITPTILYLLGMPVAKDMEGKVLAQAIKENFLKAHPITYIPTYESTGADQKRVLGERPAPEPIDSRQLEKLRSLGYVQ